MVKRRLFLAPHLDDAAISFGGTLLANRDGSGTGDKTLGVTIFSRSNYTKEGLSDVNLVTPIRQAEEKAAMSTIGVETLFLDFPESPLRGYAISDPLDYPRQIKPELDKDTVEKIAAQLLKLFPGFDEVLAPLAVGERAHVDHRLVRKAAVVVWEKKPACLFRLYEDVPYISEADRARVTALESIILEETLVDMEAKLCLIQRYESQPIESWKDFIRQAAGPFGVERTWAVKTPLSLARLGDFD